jgi:hypothetical protein
MPLHEAVALLNEGVARTDEVETEDSSTDGSSTNGHANGAANGSSTNGAPRKKTPLRKMPKIDETASGQEKAPIVAPKGGYLALDSIAADPNTEVYRLSLRTWLAPFDMGVSQDTDIILLPASEPGLYELQLRLERRSGEIAAWKRVNAGFMTELRKQLLVWRTIKPEAQQEYILTGRATVTGARTPVEAPGAVVA